MGNKPVGVANSNTKAVGDAAEDLALRYLIKQGLNLVQRNYATPGRGGGEIDLIMRQADATLVFVEVRARTSSTFGGSAASITVRKQQRIVLAARYYLSRLSVMPACRFDVVTLQGGRGVQTVEQDQIVWLQGAFNA
jgi:putative endonuclease